MERIIAAEFDTFEQAQKAFTALQVYGLAMQDMQIFYLKPGGQHGQYPIGGDRATDKASRGGGRGALLGVALGVISGALVGWWLLSLTQWPPLVLIAFIALGAYVGAISGGITRLGGRGRRRDPLNRVSGVMLAARQGQADERGVVEVLQSNGGYAIEWAQGTWVDGQWKDFNPTRTPHLYDLPGKGQHIHEVRSG